MPATSLMFAGTMDRHLVLDEWNILCDLKSTITPQVFVQLGGYSILWKRHNPKSFTKLKAVAVELRDNGTYDCQWMTPRDLIAAERTFMACYTLYNFKRDNGMIPNKEVQDVGPGTQEIREGHHPHAER